MSLVSFLHDLGIIPNKGTGVESDPNLLQGQKFMEYGRLYASSVAPHLERLQVTSIPGLSSIVETLESDDSAAGSNKIALNTVSAIEEEFNRTLAEYTTTYKLFSKEVMEKAQTQRDVSSYFGKALSDQDGNYIYVNDYGFTHRYSTDAWSQNDTSCPSNPVSIDKAEEAKLTLQGPPMGPGQPCGVAGQNVQSGDKNGEVAWVDIQGRKHVYSSALWEKKDATCKIPPIILSTELYNAIPSGGNMTSTYICDQLDVNPRTWQKLAKLNDKLLTLAEAMGAQISDLEVTDARLKQQLSQQQDVLNDYIGKISSSRQKMQGVDRRQITVGGEQESTGLVLESNRMHYLAWFLLAATIIAITVHTGLTGQPNAPGTVVVLVFCLILLFAVCKWIFSRLPISPNTGAKTVVSFVFGLIVILAILGWLFN